VSVQLYSHQLLLSIPVSDTMGHLVNNDVVLERTVATRVGDRPKVHAHTAGGTVRGCGEVGVVGTGGVLDRDGHAIVALASSKSVVLLEVEGGLGETVLVGDVVDRVDNVEGVNDGSVLLRGSDRVSTVGVRVHELIRCRLGSSGRSDGGDGVVAGGEVVEVDTVGREPAQRRGGLVLGVDERLEAVGRVLVVDGHDTVGGLCNKVRNADELAGSGIDEGLEPSVGGLVLDLDDVGQDSGVISLDNLYTYVN
jgi:hypothetical protein